MEVLLKTYMVQEKVFNTLVLAAAKSSPTILVNIKGISRVRKILEQMFTRTQPATFLLIFCRIFKLLLVQMAMFGGSFKHEWFNL